MSLFTEAASCSNWIAPLANLCWQVATLLLAPICPHTCEHIWSNLLKKKGFVINGVQISLILWAAGQALCLLLCHGAGCWMPDASAGSIRC